MKIEARVTKWESGKTKGFATITMDDCFVVSGLKIVEGNNGLFVAMPARKLKHFCSRCGKKVDLGSRYCNHCGGQLPPPPARDAGAVRQSTHQDLAHPINQEFRAYLQSKVLDAYHTEKANPTRKETAAPEGEAPEEPAAEEEK